MASAVVEPRRRRAPACRGGFTLIEILVVLGVIGILALLLLGVVLRTRGLARDSRCKSNLAQIWKAINLYANENKETLFTNLATPGRISNVAYKDQTITGWGHLYPRYLPDYRILFCQNDPVRDPLWAYGWDNWLTETGEVQCSYGYRGRQGLVADPNTNLSLSTFDSNPQKIVACDYYGDVTAPPNTHHRAHINVLRGNGMVEQVGKLPTFGPEEADFQAAVDALDR